MKRLAIILFVSFAALRGSAFAVSDSIIVFTPGSATLATIIDGNPVGNKQFNYGAFTSLQAADNNQGNAAFLIRPANYSSFPATYTTDSVFWRFTVKSARSVAGTNTLNAWRMLQTWSEGVGAGVTATAGEVSWDSASAGSVDWNSGDIRTLANGIERTAAIYATESIPAVLAVGDAISVHIPPSAFDSLVDGLIQNYGFLITFDSVENNNSLMSLFNDEDAEGNTLAGGTGSPSGQAKLAVNSISGYQAGDRLRVHAGAARAKYSDKEYVVSTATDYGSLDTLVLTTNLTATVNAGDSVTISNQPELWWFGTGVAGPSLGQRRMRMLRK